MAGREGKGPVVTLRHNALTPGASSPRSAVTSESTACRMLGLPGQGGGAGLGSGLGSNRGSCPHAACSLVARDSHGCPQSSSPHPLLGGGGILRLILENRAASRDTGPHRCLTFTRGGSQKKIRILSTAYKRMQVGPPIWADGAQRNDRETSSTA